MKRIYINEASKHRATKVLFRGFVHTIRKLSNVIFIELRDVTGLIQLVIEDESLYNIASALEIESVIEVQGIVQTSQSTQYEFELLVNHITVLNIPIEVPPIHVNEKGPQKASLAKRMNYRLLELRKPQNQLIFKIVTTLEEAFRNFLMEEHFLQIHSPKILAEPSEGGSEVFEIQYFEKKAYLAQSPQFYKQMAMAAGFEKVFEIGPAFRAEPSKTVRHSTEFTMYDVEFSYIESYEEILGVYERLVQYMLQMVQNKWAEELSNYYQKEIKVPTLSFPRLTLSEAKEILSSMPIENRKENDLSPEEEKAISAYVLEKYNHEFVCITEYPVESRAFYHMRKESNGNLTKGFDVLWNGIEITTGAQREHRYEQLVKQAKERGLTLEGLQGYFDFFKYGCPPHGGFALGPARMLMKVCGLENVREVMYVFRGMNRIRP